MDWLLGIDHSLFQWINQGWTNAFFDDIAPWLRNAKNWIPFYVGLVIAIIWKYRLTGLGSILVIAAVIGLTDFSSSELVKKTVERARPCHEINANLEPNVLVHCGSGYSFTSSHASNHFGFAMAMSLLFFRRKKWPAYILFFWATAISLSQVYVGVHFPLDIICGGLLGIILATAVYKIYRKFVPFKYQLDQSPRV